MLIRSQSKGALVNVGMVDTICIENGTEIVFFSGITKGLLGTYSSSDRAVEVITAIQDAYIEARLDEVYHEEGRIYRPVFQMPQK